MSPARVRLETIRDDDASAEPLEGHAGSSRRRLLLRLLAAPLALGSIPLLPRPGSRARRAHAQASLGWVETPARVEGDDVRVVVIGAAHPEDGPLAAVRLSTRRRALARGVAQLSRWADDALAVAQATPPQAQAIHDAIPRHAAIARVRPRADGSVVAEVRCPLEPLRAAFDAPRLPWHRSGTR